MLYTKNNQYPKPLPFRITLPDGMSRTDPATFTPEEIEQAGYVNVEYPPAANINQVVEWSAGTWVLRDKTESELLTEHNNLANLVRQKRNNLLIESDWTQVLDAPIDRDAWKIYRQALRDITSQEGFPNLCEWPILPTENNDGT